ncbi:helix-turn-helix domain-containing protein [Lelliottia sp. SL45]|uniref:helix-turn-helix domain-containing protein n=1 Tax=Lelliottia sp. SL45 TaxID=2994665 RepID=UPI0022750C88|nr:helix-turn-helix domain-containing protein [Lelliottia sp. SL45]MCY1698628.1 helix-turn-helix domain-containing protein [Lelliottia sp. SL45]MCY1699698.1 helix-turn-helix domain-containing protein [Lelliottia sp. SL45]
MSMELMVQVMKVRVGNPLRKLVLLKLADNASDKGECWPSYQHIADQCEISRRSVVSHIAALCACGFLSKETRKGLNGNASNVYRLTLAKGKAEMLESFKPAKALEKNAPSANGASASANGSPDGGAGVALGSANGASASANGSPDGGAGVAPESVTLLNQSVNQSKHYSHPDKQSDDLPGKTEKQKTKQPRIDYQEYFDTYNEILGDRLPWAKVITDKRRAALKRLLPKLKTANVEGFRAYLKAFSKMARSFYFGENERGWRADIDYILKEQTLVAVREGSIGDSEVQA